MSTILYRDSIQFVHSQKYANLSLSLYLSLSLSLYIYIYMYIYVCVCVCVRVRVLISGYIYSMYQKITFYWS